MGGVDLCDMFLALYRIDKKKYKNIIPALFIIYFLFASTIHGLFIK